MSKNLKHINPGATGEVVNPTGCEDSGLRELAEQIDREAENRATRASRNILENYLQYVYDTCQREGAHFEIEYIRNASFPHPDLTELRDVIKERAARRIRERLMLKPLSEQDEA